MPELDTRIRDYIDAAAPPITLEEAQSHRRPLEHPREAATGEHRWRWLALAGAAACVVMLVGLLAWTRSRPSDQVSVGPATTAATAATWGWLSASATEAATPAVPAGWQTLDYLDLRFSVPAKWVVAESRSCFLPGAPGVVFVPAGTHSDSVCTPATPLPSSVLTLESVKMATTGGVPVTLGTLHATRLSGGTCAGCTPMYLLPDGLALTITGPDANQILRTFTDSGTHRLLQTGPLADTRGWRPLTYKGLSLLVPPDWPTTDLSTPPTHTTEPNGTQVTSGGNFNPGFCGFSMFPPDTPARAYLGVSSMSPMCPFSAQLDLQPGQGIWIRPAGGGTDADAATVAHGKINGLDISALERPTDPALNLLVQTGSSTEEISLGAGLDTATTRAILHSLHSSG